VSFLGATIMTRSMALTAGTKLGPYEILAPLGAGGMGEVYRARDTRLERDVAVKVLPANLSSDPSLRQRMEREAKAVSKLSHPHICTLHDIGHQDGVDFLVMELVEGETLEHRLTKGPLPPEQTMRLAAQIADALAKAHKRGITHRDLKPSNIMLTKSGTKLMDFGLAKESGPAPLAAALTEMTAEQSKLTVEGTIVGTFQYMAPEQLEGKEADARTDIFALGEVIYEMATGTPAFAGKSRASLIAAILSSEPQPMAVVQPMTPPALERVVKKCLAKDPDERWQSANDLSSELSWIAEGGGHTAGAAPLPAGKKTREVLAWVICGALTVILLLGAMWWRSSKPLEQSMNFYVSLPFPARDIAAAPNGHTLALVAYEQSARKNVLWTYELGSQDARSLLDTAGASYPFWSADGRSLAFFADAKLKKLEVSGGPVQTVCDAPSGRGGTWNMDGVIIFTPYGGMGGGLYRVSASGGTPTPISNPDKSRGEQSHRWPMFLPDGRHYFYMAANFTGRKGVDAIFVGSLDSNEKRFVVEATANAAYAAPGYLLFYRDKTLLAQRFDLKRFALTGEPTTILTEIQYLGVARAVFAVSDSGVLVAQTGSGVALSQPVWFDRKGNNVGVVGKPDIYGNVSIAPNGRSVAVDKTDMASQNVDVWTYELQRESARRLTFDPATEAISIWSPDAARLVFSSNRQSNYDLYMKNSDGAQEEKNIVHDDIDKFANDWSRDGKYILYARATDLWFATLPELKSGLFLKAVSVLRNGQFSPDGKWVAYASNETGKWEIYVTSFPESRGKWQVSTGGGEQPRWRGDGKELFYLASDGKMMAAPVTIGAHFDAGTPVALFQAAPLQPFSLPDQFIYDVSRGGQRFLVITPVKQAETAPMSVVLNWPAKLNK
jgi:serine/threonine protein kinase/Tol biopolymer transport system component